MPNPETAPEVIAERRGEHFSGVTCNERCFTAQLYQALTGDTSSISYDECQDYAKRVIDEHNLRGGVLPCGLAFRTMLEMTGRGEQ